MSALRRFYDRSPLFETVIDAVLLMIIIAGLDWLLGTNTDRAGYASGLAFLALANAHRSKRLARKQALKAPAGTSAAEHYAPYMEEE